MVDRHERLVDISNSVPNALGARLVRIRILNDDVGERKVPVRTDSSGARKVSTSVSTVAADVDAGDDE